MRKGYRVLNLLRYIGVGILSVWQTKKQVSIAYLQRFKQSRQIIGSQFQ